MKNLNVKLIDVRQKNQVIVNESETNFETYLLINKKKFILCVIHNKSLKQYIKMKCY